MVRPGIHQATGAVEPGDWGWEQGTDHRVSDGSPGRRCSLIFDLLPGGCRPAFGIR